MSLNASGLLWAVHRRVDPRVALWLAGGVFALAALLGLVLAAYVGWELVVAGALCMVIAFSYSGGPRPIANTPVGEWFAGGTLGLVLITLASYVQQGSVDRGVVLLGLPSTILIACILTVNNTCDIEGDRKAGRHTLSIALGADRSRKLIDGLLVATWAFAFALIPLRVLTVGAAVPLAVAGAFAWLISRTMHKRGYSHASKATSMRGISLIFCAYTLAILLALALSAAGAARVP